MTIIPIHRLLEPPFGRKAVNIGVREYYRLDKRAFTLAELLIVVAVMSILSLIALPNLRLAKHRAKIGKALADMKIIQTAVEAYRMDHGVLPPDIDGFVPFILTDAFSRPVAYLPDNRSMKDPLNDFKPNPRQWRFETYRFINIKGRLEDMPGLNGGRKPSEWLPVTKRQWREAHSKYGDYLIATTKIKHKDNFKKDDLGRSKAMAKWNEFYWKPGEGEPKFMELKHEPLLSAKMAWNGMDYIEEDESNGAFPMVLAEER